METLVPPVAGTSSVKRTGSSELARSKKPIKSSAGRKRMRMARATDCPRTLSALARKELLMRTLLANVAPHLPPPRRHVERRKNIQILLGCRAESAGGG